MEQNNMVKWMRVFALSLSFVFLAAGICAMHDPVTAEAAVQSTKKVTIKEGKTTTVSVKNPVSKVSWSSNKKKVVKVVKQTGKNKSKATLKGIKKGTATITAKTGNIRYVFKVTVKHTHKYSAATCTRPKTCACGATKGSALGHMMTTGTCREQTICVRCYVRGNFGPHAWSSGNYKKCNLCNTRYLPDFYDAFFYSLGANLSSIQIAMIDYYGLTTIIGTGRGELEKAIFCPDGKTRRTVYLWKYTNTNAGYYTGSIDYGSGMGSFSVYYDADVASNGYAAVGPNSTITYQLSYGGEKFLVKAGVNGIIEWKKLANWTNL